MKLELKSIDIYFKIKKIKMLLYYSSTQDDIFKGH